LNFVVIDVETANPDLSSICQVGVVTFADGFLKQSWSSLVNPEDYFDGMNVSIHGIDEHMVRSAPKWPMIYERLLPVLEHQIVASHTAFDRASLLRISDKHSLPYFNCSWLDTARVVRRAWPEFAQSGYGLANVASHLGITFHHHDAKEDARAAGEILLRAISDTGLTVEQWLHRQTQPINPATAQLITREANPDGSLYGEILVFTGALSMTRREAADLAASAGCEVAPGVTKHTTLLVVGDQDIKKLAGHEKSSKHRKVEELIAEGQRIRILGESDFRRMLEDVA
jgi:DNA polymerase-3 subunit epsilon